MNRKLIFQIVSNTLIMSLGKIMAVGLSFISIVLLTRYLGLEGYGNYTLIFSYLAFFSLIADFGMQVVAIKEIAGSKEKGERLYGTYFLLRGGFTILSTLLALVFLFFFPYPSQLKIGIAIGAVAVGISGMTGYFNTIFQANVRLDLLTFLDILGRIGGIIGIAICVFFRLDFYFIVGSVLVGNLVSFIGGTILLPNTITIHFDSQVAKRLFFLSLPVGITSLLSTLYFKIDTIILSLFKSPADVGIYSLAYKILENITLFWIFYTGTTYPLLAKFKTENKRKYKSLFKNSVFLAIGISLPLIVVTYFLAPLAVYLFGGVAFSQSTIALRILLFSLPFLLINILFYNLYILEEFNVVVIIGMTISLIFNIVSNIIFIPHFSYIAASYITVFSEIILLVTYILGLFYLRRKPSLQYEN